MTKEKLIVSISGGRTSGYMAKLCHDNLKDTHDVLYVFANTGMEHDDTLRFLHDIEVNFGLPIVWLEGVYAEGIGPRHRIVNYETAFRWGDWDNELHPYHSLIKKLGVPCNPAPFCTRDLKLGPINSYLKEIGWMGEPRAIGIRTDENRRVAKNATKDKIVYPLLDWWPADKEDVLLFWEDFEWDLTIPERWGNCITCFKKSDKKLHQVWKENPAAYDFNREMENRYSRQHYRYRVKGDNGRGVFFRGDRSTYDLIQTFEVMDDEAAKRLSDAADGGCSESCEMYETTQLDMWEQS